MKFGESPVGDGPTAPGHGKGPRLPIVLLRLLLDTGLNDQVPFRIVQSGQNLKA